MHPIHDAPPRGPDACRRAVLALVLIAAAACAAPATARAAHLHPEYGLAFRALLGGAGELASPSGGMDFDVHVVNEDGGLGWRAVLGANTLESAGQVRTSGTFIVWPISGTFTAEQNISLIAGGPSWSFPRASGRGEIYLLGGIATVQASGNGMLINTSGSEPGDSRTWVTIAGALWAPRIKRAHLTLELGGEVQVGGRATFWDDPPVVQDITGYYHYRTRHASVTGVAFRAGLGYR